MSLADVRVLLLDLDNVLLRVHDECGNYYWRVNIERDLGIPGAEMSSFFTSAVWKAITRGEVKFQEALRRFLKERGLRCPAERVIEYFYEGNARPNTPMFQIIGRLTANFACYIATNQEAGRIEGLWEKLFKNSGFRGYFSSHAIGQLKPHGAFWDYIEKELHVPDAVRAENILLVDDRESNVTAAVARGMQGYYFTEFAKAEREVFGPLLARPSHAV